MARIAKQGAAIPGPASVFNIRHRAPVSGRLSNLELHIILVLRQSNILLEGNFQKPEDSNTTYSCLEAPLQVDTVGLVLVDVHRLKT